MDKLFYDSADFEMLCKHCKDILTNKYKYYHRDDRFWLEEIGKLREVAASMIDFVKIIEKHPRQFGGIRNDIRAKELLERLGID